MSLSLPKKRLLAVAAVVVIAAAGLAYVKRQDIKDAVFRAEQGPIPAPMTRDEIAGRTTPEPQPPEQQPSAPEPVKNPPTNVNTAPPPTPAPAPAPAPTPTPTVRASINLSVIFIPQAPKMNWDAMHEDTCEESSMAMVDAYLKDVHSMTTDEMENELQAIVSYENKTIGYFQSTNTETTAQVMRGYFGLKNVKVIALTSIDDVKKLIAAGRPVMLPTSGRALGNPYFSGAGPVYHMVVAKGYTETRIITNDPGTKRGADYTYSNDTLWKAIGEWTGSGTDTSKKSMIVVE